jgi:pimeloyl-ACP methyl ester carboxylesterase
MTIARTIRTAALATALAAGLAACSSSVETSKPQGAEGVEGSTTTSSTVPAPARPTEDVDGRFALGSTQAKMHLSCSGSGSSTVVLMSGFGDDGGAWGAVAPDVAKEARVCTYDRFGLGTSDAPPSDPTFTTQAADLHELLEVAGEPGPYVVAGHSFGGAAAVAFASQFADEVEGLLLLDASPIDWPKAACAVPDDGSEMAGVFQDTCATITDPARNPEHLDAAKAFAGVAGIDDLGDVPLVVASRAEVAYPGLAPEVEAELVRTTADGQEHWASLSSNATVVLIADTSHYIQVDQPAKVVDLVTRLVQRA